MEAGLRLRLPLYGGMEHLDGHALTCTATDASLPNMSCRRPMSHLDPSETKISPAVMPVLP